jgi:hypothetical protein
MAILLHNLRTFSAKTVLALKSAQIGGNVALAPLPYVFAARSTVGQLANQNPPCGYHDAKCNRARPGRDNAFVGDSVGI